MRQRTTEDIWSEFGQRLRGFILKRIPEPADADDILQDVFVKLHTRIDTLRDQDRLAPWLYQIARNTIIDYYRARQPLAPLSEAIRIEDEPETGDPEARIARGLVGMIDRLPDKYRQAVVLSELQGLPQHAVADRLGLSLSGAKSRVQRGRQLLRQALLDCCHFEFDRLGGLIDYTPKPACCPRCATQ